MADSARARLLEWQVFLNPVAALQRKNIKGAELSGTDGVYEETRCLDGDR
jgi:hypothetical protein